MAQERHPRGGKGSKTSNVLGSSTINDGSLNPLDDPLAGYYRDNFEAVAKDSTLNIILNTLTDKLVSKGFVFILEDGTICKPEASFMSIIDGYWYHFITQAIRFIACKGYLVWFKSKTDCGIEVPEVPDWRSIRVEHSYDEKTGSSEIRAWWADNKYTSQLYVIHKSLPFGVTKGFQTSLIDTIKPTLLFLYHMDRCRMLTFHRLAQPDILLTEPVKTSGSSVQQDQLPPSDLMTRWLTSYDDQIDDDNNLQDRIGILKDKQQEANLLEENTNLRPPHVRLQLDMMKSLVERFVGAPRGTIPSLADTRVPDLEYLQTRNKFLSEIAAAFGLSDFISSGILAAKPGADGSGGGGGGRKGGDGYDNSPAGDRLLMWKETLRRVLTSVFRILYSKSSIQVGDVKATYQDQHRKIVRGSDVWEVHVIRPEVGIDDPLESSAPPAKKQRLDDSIEEDEDGKRDPAMLKHKHTTKEDIAAEVADETEKVKKSQQQTTVNNSTGVYGRGGGGGAGGAAGDGAGEEIEGNTDNITMMLMSHLLGNRDTADLLRRQKGISDDAYFEMHPPVEVDTKKEKGEEKRQQEFEKQQEKLQKEKDKFKEEKKEQARKTEMDDLRQQIKDLHTALAEVKKKKNKKT